ncbi:hypothetical protein E2C01_035485 [Portunus trituberculatus]|uniref:Uncharacterized protein n=1 Tax=Portunus trituberculatus TaxID=210409 RepID=A0A5B7F9G7_PORTR|nr:hypothetical protein [Portunus trituberculatus]
MTPDPPSETSSPAVKVPGGGRHTSRVTSRHLSLAEDEKQQLTWRLVHKHVVVVVEVVVAVVVVVVELGCVCDGHLVAGVVVLQVNGSQYGWVNGLRGLSLPTYMCAPPSSSRGRGMGVLG